MIEITKEQNKEIHELKESEHTFAQALNRIIECPNGYHTLHQWLFEHSSFTEDNESQVDFAMVWDSRTIYKVKEDCKYYIHLIDVENGYIVTEKGELDGFTIGCKSMDDGDGTFKSRFTLSEIEKLRKVIPFEIKGKMLEKVED